MGHVQDATNLYSKLLHDLFMETKAHLEYDDASQSWDQMHLYFHVATDLHV